MAQWKAEGLVYIPAVTMHLAATKGWQRCYETALLLSETVTDTTASWGFKKMNKLINILCYYYHSCANETR